MGYRRTTPVNVMLTEACEPRLEDRFTYLGFNYISRVLANPQHMLLLILDNIRTILDNPVFIMKFFPPLFMECYMDCDPIAQLIEKSILPFHFQYPLATQYAQSRISFKEGEFLQYSANPRSQFTALFPSFNHQVHIFTDGFKIAGNPFSGFAIINKTRDSCSQYRTSNKSSIFSSEAMALAPAFQSVFDIPEKIIYLFSDSKSVLQAILFKGCLKKSSHLIWIIRKLLYDLELLGKELSLFWIPAHVGIESNELTDLVAKNAAIFGRDTPFLLPHSDLQALWKEKLFTNFQEWAQSRGAHKGSYYFNTFFTPKRTSWFHTFSLNRKGMVSINRLRAGHTTLAECLWKHHIIDSPYCECDQVLQTANHVFW